MGIFTSSGNTSGTIGKVFSVISDLSNSGIFKTIRDNAKRKKAQEIANAGGYNTLSEYQKSLLIGYANTPVPGILSGVPTPFLIIAGLIVGLVLFLIIRNRR